MLRIRNFLKVGKYIQYQAFRSVITESVIFIEYTVVLQLEFKLIDKFVSREVPDPPACVVHVYAKDSSDTEEIFHYPVPLVGVNKPEKTFIHLSLRINPIAGT